jgi:hypothetical protein
LRVMIAKRALRMAVLSANRRRSAFRQAFARAQRAR